MVASHNEDTVRFAIEKMNEIGIHPEDKVICFGQLLGMCDYITFPLGELKFLMFTIGLKDRENLHSYGHNSYGPVNVFWTEHPPRASGSFRLFPT